MPTKISRKSFLDWLKLPNKKEINLDAPSSTLLHKEIIFQKIFLKKIYEDFYAQFSQAVHPYDHPRVIVELGSGGGFLKDIIPDVISSDVLDIPGIDIRLSGTAIPFKDKSVDAFLLFDVLHHINNATLFFQEADRCLKSGGKIVMIEPTNSMWSRFIYSHFHHEPFDPKTDWKFTGTGALSSSNIALPWIIFYRDVQKFKQAFPSFNILKIENHTPFRYIASGGLSFRELVPAFTYPLVLGLERILSPFNNSLGMFMTIELRKIK